MLLPGTTTLMVATDGQQPRPLKMLYVALQHVCIIIMVDLIANITASINDYPNHILSVTKIVVLGALHQRCDCYNDHSQVTPDGQRTMRTSLGAALGLTSADALPPAWWQDAAVLHCEGYTLYKAAMAEAAMRTAKRHGLQVSLDLASFELVHNCGDALARVLREGLVDVVFCNEEEACAVLELAQLGGDGSAVAGHVNGDADARVCWACMRKLNL